MKLQSKISRLLDVREATEKALSLLNHDLESYLKCKSEYKSQIVHRRDHKWCFGYVQVTYKDYLDSEGQPKADVYNGIFVFDGETPSFVTGYCTGCRLDYREISHDLSRLFVHAEDRPEDGNYCECSTQYIHLFDPRKEVDPEEGERLLAKKNHYAYTGVYEIDFNKDNEREFVVGEWE